MKQEKFCENPDCNDGPAGGPRPSQEGRKFCPRCTKRAQRVKKGGIALSAPPVERLPPMERVIEAGTAMLETPAEAPPTEFEARKRAFIAAARVALDEARRKAISRGLAQARAQGVRIGRPPKMDAQAVALGRVLVVRVGLMAAAQALEVDRRTLARALRQEGNVSAHAGEGAPAHKSKVSVTVAEAP